MAIGIAFYVLQVDYGRNTQTNQFGDEITHASCRNFRRFQPVWASFGYLDGSVTYGPYRSLQTDTSSVLPQ